MSGYPEVAANYLINASEFNPQDEDMDEVDKLMFHNQIMEQSLQLNQSIVHEEDAGPRVIAPDPMSMGQSMNDLKKPLINGELTSTQRADMRYNYLKDI